MYSKLHAQIHNLSDDLRIVGTFKEYADFYRNTDVNAYKYAMDLLMKHIKTRSNAHVLDIGCGGGWTLDLLQNEFKEISLVEPNPYLREHWESKSWFNGTLGKHIVHVYPNTIQELIHAKSFEENSIDLIILYHSLYHFEIETLKETLDQIISWLKDDGVCFITVMDDDNPFVQNVFKSVSPNYGLSDLIENMLYHNNNNNSYYLKYREVITFELSAPQYLDTLKWITMQSCLNQNYFADGLSEEQLDEMHQECGKYVQTTNNDGIFELSNIHFVFKKNVVPPQSNRNVYICIGAFVLLCVIFVVIFRSFFSY